MSARQSLPSVALAKRLERMGADILVVDKAHGYTDAVISKVKALKKMFKGVEIIAGNVVDPDAAEALIKIGPEVRTAVSALFQVLMDEDVRSHAAEALEGFAVENHQ